MWAYGVKAKRMDMENSSSKMEVIIRDNLWIINCREKVSTIGIRKRHTRVSGCIIKWQDMELFCGKMEINMKVNLSMTRYTEMANSFIKMVLIRKVNGKKVGSMVK